MVHRCSYCPVVHTVGPSLFWTVSWLFMPVITGEKKLHVS